MKEKFGENNFFKAYNRYLRQRDTIIWGTRDQALALVNDFEFNDTEKNNFV